MAEADFDSRNVLQLLQDRRSCATFAPSVVDLQSVQKIALAAGFTPSEQDLQPWRIHVARGASLSGVCSAMLHSNVEKVRQAGVALIFSGDTSAIDDRAAAAKFYATRSRRDFVVRNVSMYLMAFMLVSESYGYATRPMAGFDEALLAEVCGFGPTQFPVAVLLIGAADPYRKPPPRSMRLSYRELITDLGDQVL
ncbi:nitroreductase family protein [Nocardia sp. NPDC001965]